VRIKFHGLSKSEKTRAICIGAAIVGLAVGIWIGLFVVVRKIFSSVEEKEMRENLFQRFIADMGQGGITTNIDSGFMREIFDGFVVHPSFGLRWNEIPAPTINGLKGMKGIQDFVATNGWNMDTNWHGVEGSKCMKLIQGLPWEAIKSQEFPAVSHDGILYILLKGWHHNLSGIAYNPNTNAFASGIAGFRPIGDHWYAWAEPEDPITLVQRYEGKKP
jgi:hypothetical protein